MVLTDCMMLRPTGGNGPQVGVAIRLKCSRRAKGQVEGCGAIALADLSSHTVGGTVARFRVAMSGVSVRRVVRDVAFTSFQRQ